MSNIPERISVKRRRQDDPVDTFYLEIGTSQVKKRRFTDFCFKRLHNDEPTVQPHPSNLRQATQPASLTAAQNAIPLVRATAPGSEVVETQAYLTAVKRSLNTDHRDTTTANDAPSQNPAGTANLIDHTKHAERDDTHRVRRFFLRRDDQDPLQPSRDAGIRKKPADRNGSAVFMEDSSRSSRPGSRSSSSMRPIDRILNHTAQSPNVGQGQTPSTEATSSLDNHNQSPFQKPKSGITRTGKSIRDHPSTWNHDSDQLADELAALAIGMDTDSGVGLGADIHAQNIAQSQHGLEDEYVYETYLRIPHSNLAVSRDSQAGVLIVEDQDQELWHELIGNDEDEMWDAEDNDSNAEDNPANDYPEDESSDIEDDTYGRYDSHEDY